MYPHSKISKFFIIVIVSFAVPFLNAQPSELEVSEKLISPFKYEVRVKTAIQFDTFTKEGRSFIRVKGAVDESKKGFLSELWQDVFVAISPNSNPRISYTYLDYQQVEAIPVVNPDAALEDEKLIYRDLNFPLGKNEDSYDIKNMGYLWIGNNYAVHLKIPVFYYDENKNRSIIIDQYKLELSFSNDVILPDISATVSPNTNEYLLNPKLASLLEGNPKWDYAKTDDWIDYSKEYVKLGVFQDGVYRIYPADLQAIGINLSSINPRTLKLFNKGIEQPIYVDGETDNSFSGNDFIEFIGLRNMGGKHREISGYNEPYNEYLGRYTDTSIYWLTWGGANGSRVYEKNLNSGLAVDDTLKYYYETLHFERNPWFDFSMADLVRRESPYWNENKTWHDNDLNVGQKNITFNVNNVFTNEPTYLLAKMQDKSSNVTNDAHLVAISLNNEPEILDSTYINKYEKIVLEGMTNSIKLNNGNNIVKVHSFPTQNTINKIHFDWAELEYPRSPVLSNDSLHTKFDRLDDGTKVRQIEFDGFVSNSVVIWKFGFDNNEANNFRRYSAQPAGGTVTFTDSVDVQDRQFIYGENSIKKPVIYYHKNFKNLRSSQNQADYLAITHPIFINSVNGYLNFIEEEYNLTTKIIDINDIYDEFSYGYFSPEPIKDFLKAAKTNWTNPKPQYVFFIGSATYDYHGNKVKHFTSVEPVYNYVPSYGAPVSDNWFVNFNETGAFIPEYKIGRLPVEDITQLNWYFQKHQNFASAGFDEWNKTYLFFSGGDENTPGQIEQLKAVNDEIINNFTAPPPIGGNYTHFYKTVNPFTNFGPYTDEEIEQAIEAGGVFISYIGHSGTRIWDNSITEPSDLANTVNRYPLVTDFGCSTGRFAEPDVISFSQLFTLDNSGQAVGYIGNSSLGFLSSATTFPQIFYKKVLSEGKLNVSDALNSAKVEFQSIYGTSAVNQLFALTNTLLGDPIFTLQIPTKPNLFITNESYSLNDDTPNDLSDSLTVKVFYKNIGTVQNQSFNINVRQTYQSEVIFEQNFNKQLPVFSDSLMISLPIKSMPGAHTVNIKLDQFNQVDEVSEEDNDLVISFNVGSSDLRIFMAGLNTNAQNVNIQIVNPLYKPTEQSFILEISQDENFGQSSIVNLNLNEFSTSYPISALQNNARHWVRAYFSGNAESGIIKSFYKTPDIDQIIIDQKSFDDGLYENTFFNNQDKLRIKDKSIEVVVNSAGFNDGNYGIIEIDGTNYVGFPNLLGHHVVVFDTLDLNFIDYQRFPLFNDNTGVIAQAYIDYLNNLGTDKYIAIAVADEGRVSNATLKQMFRDLGSKYIDSLQFRSSWAFLGRKSDPSFAKERHTLSGQGNALYDTSFIRLLDKGKYFTPVFGPSGGWTQLNIISEIPNGTQIKLRPVGIRNNGIIDTLSYLSTNILPINISSISSSVYPYVKFIFELEKGESLQSPKVESVELNYRTSPELGINYQSVTISADTINQGDNIDLSINVHNIGESNGSNVGMNIKLINEEKEIKIIYQTTINSILPTQSKKVEFSYQSNFDDGYGDMIFEINIDPDNAIPELYKDNNSFRIPFYVIKDTVTNIKSASVLVDYDGSQIVDGDFVTSNPDINILLTYQSKFPVQDTNAVKFYMDLNRIYYNQLEIEYDSVNREVNYNFNPTLEPGLHQFKIEGDNILSAESGNAGYEKTFIVSDETKLVDVYNYPNPFSSVTNFIMRLTNVPDEIQINIYTIAGRLIKKIVKQRSDLKIDTNKFEWDGKDEDGNFAANGVYLYKVILKSADINDSVTNKLAIVR